MTQLADDQDVTERILDHIASRTTDLADDTWREPVDRYLNADLLAAEYGVLRRQPTPFCPSAALPDAGSYLARDAAGTPLLAVRGKDHQVRVFRNVCRHRGMAVAEGSGCRGSFTCPYHAWTYRLDGSLRHVPHEHGFPDLVKEDRGLVPVTAVERHGLVFVTQDGPALPGPAIDQFAGVLTDLPLLSTNQHEEPVNWKLMVETFLEGYHIRALHGETFYPLQFDNLNVVETFAEHSRVAYPYRNIKKLVDVPPAERRADGVLTYLYHFFPNVVVATFPDRRAVIVLDPVALDRTNVIFYTLPAEPSRELRPDRPEPGQFLADGLTEDFAAARAIQRGLASGANQHLEFGRFEGAITHFHRHLDAALEVSA